MPFWEASLGRKPHADAGSILGKKLRSETKYRRCFIWGGKPRSFEETRLGRKLNVDDCFNLRRQISVGNHLLMLAPFWATSFGRKPSFGDASCEETRIHFRKQASVGNQGSAMHHVRRHPLAAERMLMFRAILGGKSRSETTC